MILSFIGNMMSETFFNVRQFFLFQRWGDCPSSLIKYLSSPWAELTNGSALNSTIDFPLREANSIKIFEPHKTHLQCKLFVKAPMEETVFYGIIYIIHSIYCEPDEWVMRPSCYQQQICMIEWLMNRPYGSFPPFFGKSKGDCCIWAPPPPTL